MADAGLYLSLIATTLSVASFGGGVWRIWRDRPRLQFFVTTMTFTNVPKFGDMKMVQVMICNVGYRPVILTGFAAIASRSAFQMGIDDEPAAVLGKQDQRFPTLLEPGKTLKIHPIAFESLKRNVEPQDGLHHDPFLYFVTKDSFGRLYPIRVQDVLWHLDMIKSWKPLRGLERYTEWKIKRRTLRHARKRFFDP
jgi:hypothetical protein